MMKKPETQQTLAQAAGRIPTASPYHDRLRSLRMQMMEVSVGSDEYACLDRQIRELEQRARRRVAMDRAIGL